MELLSKQPYNYVLTLSREAIGKKSDKHKQRQHAGGHCSQGRSGRTQDPMKFRLKSVGFICQILQAHQVLGIIDNLSRDKRSMIFVVKMIFKLMSNDPISVCPKSKLLLLFDLANPCLNFKPF